MQPELGGITADDWLFGRGPGLGGLGFGPRASVLSLTGSRGADSRLTDAVGFLRRLSKIAGADLRLQDDCEGEGTRGFGTPQVDALRCGFVEALETGADLPRTRCRCRTAHAAGAPLASCVESIAGPIPAWRRGPLCPACFGHNRCSRWPVVNSCRADAPVGRGDALPQSVQFRRSAHARARNRSQRRGDVIASSQR